MTKYNYRLFYFSTSMGLGDQGRMNLEDKLKEFSDKGWELTNVVFMSGNGGNGLMHYFRKKITKADNGNEE